MERKTVSRKTLIVQGWVGGRHWHLQTKRLRNTPECRTDTPRQQETVGDPSY